MSIEGNATRTGVQALRATCGGAVHLPGDAGYDAARMAWNVAVSLKPAAVAYPASTAEVSELVRVAAAAGLQLTTQSTGHNASPLGDLADVVLVKTSAMTGVAIDPSAGVATAAAGALWLDVVEAAAAHGLTVLHGSSPDVGVLGYSLGGGMGWYARALGMQTSAVTGATVVVADGSVVHVSASENADLFWAIRGGGGNFGIVTELEFRTFPFSDTYAGVLMWDWQHAERVLRTWADWAVTAPNEVTTSFRILQLPPIPEIPEPFRGRNWVVIDGAVLADDAAAAEIIAPLRDLDPELDTFARVPTASLIRLHMDPEGPTPVVTASALLGSMPSDAIDAFLDAAGPDSDSMLTIAELRQLGGVLADPAENGGAVSHLEGQFLCFAAAIAPTPEVGRLGAQQSQHLASTLDPWATGREYLNFAERSIDTSRGYEPNTWLRLREIKRGWDPDCVFLGNHAIPPAIR